MTEGTRAQLPIQLAIRTLLDDVSYRAALPEWFEPQIIDYSSRETTVLKLIDTYLDGAQPAKPYQVEVPKRDGTTNTWIVPRINDQIICQACISAIAHEVQARTLDTTRVFSSRLNRDPNSVALLEDQVSAWALFKARMAAACTQADCVLQIDLKNAFDSIRLERMRAFIESIGADATASQLLVKLLKVFGEANGGLPFLNDSIFFLGNAYFSEVDKIVRKGSPDFIRYVDDYKIFGRSRQGLEAEFERIRSEAQAIGLTINEGKLWLGSGEEYLDSLSNQKYGTTETTEYLSETVSLPGVFDAAFTLSKIANALQKPDEYMHQGYGRLQMAAIRRMRVGEAYSNSKAFGAAPAAQFAEQLAKDTSTVELICDRLEQYARDAGNTWRLIWVLYLCQDFGRADLKIADAALDSRLTAILERIRNSSVVAPVARLWARAVPKYQNFSKSISEIEELQSLDYLERGQRCYGV